MQLYLVFKIFGSGALALHKMRLKPHFQISSVALYFLFFIPLFLYSTPFKIASYNVQNLFDLQKNGTEYKEYIPFTHQWNIKTKEIKLNHIAEVICDVDADIIGLQEIENRNIFLQLVKRLKQVGCAYDYYAISHKKGSSIQIALLSRFNIEYQKDIIVSVAPKVRNILEVNLNIEGNWLSVFVNHWKSKAYSGVESKRIVYAKALKNRLNMIKNEYRSRDRQSKRVHMALHWQKDISLDFLHELDEDIRNRRLQNAIDSLDEKHRQCFLLRHQEGLSIKEVSVILQCPEGTVKSRLHYALKHLSVRLEKVRYS